MSSRVEAEKRRDEMWFPVIFYALLVVISISYYSMKYVLKPIDAINGQ